MYVERLKRWQWMIVGVILGAIVGWVKLWGGVDAPDSGTHLHVFEDQLIKAVDPSRKIPLQVGQITLHPPSEVPLLGSKELGKREIITYWVWYPQKVNAKNQPIAFPKEHAVVLYRDPAQKSVFGDISKLGGREYLDKLRSHIQKLDRNQYRFAQNFDYRYAWLETPRGAYLTYCTGGILIIGLVWPTIINLLVGAGYGRPVTDDEDAKYLARFKGTSTTTQHKPIKIGMSDAELAELAAMEARLEAQLKDSGLSMTDKKPAGKSKETAAQTAEKAAKKFTGAAAEELKPVPTKADAHKDFGTDQGDYYPTEVHGKAKQ